MLRIIKTIKASVRDINWLYDTNGREEIIKHTIVKKNNREYCLIYIIRYDIFALYNEVLNEVKETFSSIYLNNYLEYLIDKGYEVYYDGEE